MVTLAAAVLVPLTVTEVTSSAALMVALPVTARAATLLPLVTAVPKVGLPVILRLLADPADMPASVMVVPDRVVAAVSATGPV